MPPFRKPTFAYDYDVDHELRALRAYPTLPDRLDRAIPPKQDDRLLLVTWNIANLGVQQRREQDYRLIAEILSWFDLAALQEVNDNLSGLRGIQQHLPERYHVLFTDPGGNRERFTFIYDAEKVGLLEEVGRVTVPPAELRHVRLPDVAQVFTGFDRNPALASWKCGALRLTLANVHLYFGDDGPAGMDRRCLEAFAVARWAGIRRANANAYTSNILALGDFNLPSRGPGDRVFRALTRSGLMLPEHSTRVPGTNLSDDAQYDQMAVFPGPVRAAVRQLGVFDFDGAVFRDLWGDNPSKTEKARFRSYVKYYLSDHRPLWADVAI